jgi:DNA adenine methylase
MTSSVSPLVLIPQVQTGPKPFLKWAGGKTQLIGQFSPLIPRKFGRYYEPFVGGGAVFFALRPRNALLSDVNGELIDCYQAIRDNVDAVIAALKQHRYDKDYFYQIRSLAPSTLTLPERAARTIFLNRTGFNGLYRVNSRGQFNVPFGRYANPTICDERNLRACSLALKGARLTVEDFEQAVCAADHGDFVYFDPPYVPVSDTSYFTSYTPGGFGWNEQQRLASVFAKLAERGIRVMLSNSDVPALRELYAGFRIDRVEATRSINCDSRRRGKIGEVVVRSYQ